MPRTALLKYLRILSRQTREVNLNGVLNLALHKATSNAKNIMLIIFKKIKSDYKNRNKNII